MQWNTFEAAIVRAHNAFEKKAFQPCGALLNYMGKNQVHYDIPAVQNNLLFQSVVSELSQTAPIQREVLQHVVNTFSKQIQTSDMFQDAERIKISGRCKDPYSAWKKMSRHNSCSLGDVLDTIGIRLVITSKDSPNSVLEGNNENSPNSVLKGNNEIELCYKIRDFLHSLWPFDYNRNKDYIQFPKDNGYRSLHSGVFIQYKGFQFPVELQIRSENMDQTAEFGLAAHSLYKRASNFEGGKPFQVFSTMHQSRTGSLSAPTSTKV